MIHVFKESEDMGQCCSVDQTKKQRHFIFKIVLMIRLFLNDVEWIITYKTKVLLPPAYM